ncbi:MAG TPA: ABC transporter substrate-binding protein [Xanthobacteraceae bacterium]|jgi:branched-chain amino acid transport system substrate-binding protein|nr:ABC transporter substrate-binding protein [Xanthobacteraceae bacterium]
MNRVWLAALIAVWPSLLPAAGYAEDAVKIGIIMPYSGQFADPAAQSENGLKLYLKQHGDKLGGRVVEIIRKDTGGINPPVAKRLAQELVTRDNVDILTGFQLTPNALAAADVSAEAKKFMVILNAGTAIITTKSNYIARVSFTVPQLNQTLATWAAQNGLKSAYTLVADFGPGIDAEAAFQKGFKEAGGEIVGSVRMAVQSPDFSAYVQRAKDLDPQGIFIMIPGGAQPGAFGKALAERGVDPKKIEVLGQAEITDEHALASMGDIAIGIITASHYDYTHRSPLNDEFVQAYANEYHRNPDFFSVGGYDGMHLIDVALQKSGGKTDGDSLINAAKGASWESPRGPISIDPETRDIVQTVYIRKVEKVGDRLVNVEIAAIPNVKDPYKASMGK